MSSNDISVKECRDNPDNYRPIHRYSWAKRMARLGFHLTCDSLEDVGMRMVYTDKGFTIRRYNELGLTERTAQPSVIEEESDTWRLWDN